MDTIEITKEMLRKNCFWEDEKTFIACLSFSKFPKKLLSLYKDLIKKKDMKSGYLCCEYWVAQDEADIDCFVYNFNFSDNSVSVNEYFCKPLYNDMIKELSEETGKE